MNATLLAVTLSLVSAGAYAAAAVAQALLTLLVVVGTANHYWLDAIVVVALLAVAYAALGLPRTPVRAHLPWASVPALNYAWT
ncbi:hypothetical protein [Streptomyces sp. wa22]|uniref:hypothetical protein n=1 Tax=Streptomyces sp. wa22 TaxID=1828244 RepID=UPI0021C9C111|nr:hypothetical protein [Streptomyces sp. wa22]